MPPTFFARFFFVRAAVVAAACLLIACAALMAPLGRELSLGAGQRGVAQLAPLILFPLVATPSLLALAER